VLTAGVTIKIGSISNKRASQKRQQMAIVSEGPRIEQETETEPQATTQEAEVVRAETKPQPEAKTEQTASKTETNPGAETQAADQKETERKGTIVSDLSPEIQLVVMREALLTEQIARAVTDGDSAKAEFLKSEREELRSQLMTVGFKKLKEEEETDVRSAPVLDTRTFTLPVLEEGEIYIRFGKPEPRQQPTVSEALQTSNDVETRTQDLENAVSSLLDEYLQKESVVEGSDTVDTNLEEMESRLIRLMGALESRPATDQNIDARLESFEQKVLELLENQPTEAQERRQDLDARFNEFENRILNILEQQTSEAQELGVVSREIEPRIASGNLTRQTQGRDLQGLSVYTGFSNPLQMLIGVRADYGAILGNRLQMLPEFTLGFGSSTTMYNINMNILYDLEFIGFEEFFTPYIGIGVGMMAFTNPPDNLKGIQLTGSMILGTEYLTNKGAFFADYTNYNLFKVNRLQVGYRFYF
jgi:hypothetical protein